jgi:catechol 2,3-dioxygenase-like lactoylglutathione lyase family enzyme
LKINSDLGVREGDPWGRGEETMIKAMHHTAICVKDMDRSLAFYRDLLGMKVTIDSRISGPDIDKILSLENSEARRVYVAGYGGRIELFQFDSPKSRPLPDDFRVCDVGITHVAFEVENIPEIYEDLSVKGVKFHNPPLAVKGRGMVCYLRDPDGIVLEFIELFTPGT